jgi:hypothetical protein
MGKQVSHRPELDSDEQCDICGSIGETNEYYDQQLWDNCMETQGNPLENRVLFLYNAFLSVPIE